MPQGRCSGCGDETFLPPFGGGTCFLCATDGQPNRHAPTGGALAEDAVRSDPTADWWEPSEEQTEIADLFDEVQTRYHGAIRVDAIVASRFDRSVRSYLKRRDGLTSYEQRELEEREDRRRTKRARAALRREAVAGVRRERQERESRERSQREKHERRVAAYADRVEATKIRRNGGGNYADPMKLETARRMRLEGASLRRIAAATGLHRETVRA